MSTTSGQLPLAILERSIAQGVSTLRRACDVDVALGGPYDPANPASIAIKTLDGAHGQTLRNLRVTTGYGVGGKALALARPVTIGDYLTEPQIVHAYDRAVAPERIASVVAVPVLISGSPRGMLYLASRSHVEFGPRTLSRAMGAARRIERDILVEEGVRRRLAAERERLRAELPAPTRTAGDLDDLRTELDDVIASMHDEEAKERLRGLSRRLMALTAAPAGAIPPPPGPLTAREIEVLRLVALGMTNSEAAQAIGLTQNTVKTYLQSATRKLGATNRTQAARLAREAGIIG
jgi:DNA-binding CsgD family transcriptional regulator